MNLMYFVLSSAKFTNKNNKLVTKVELLRENLKKEKFKVTDKFTKLGDTYYYNNAIPNITKERDVLVKPNSICNIRVNWKKKPFTGLSTSEAYEQLKQQYGWCVTTVDAEHTRNKYKNKTIAWVIFDTESEAKRNMSIFNSMFITAIEWDAIEEYRRFKQNPSKRPLTFDQLVENYAELYDMVDKHEI